MIALIDDDADVRMSLANYFRAAGLEIRTFESAEAFLDAPERMTTGCLVTDLHLGGIDGAALQSELNRSGPAFPVIVMTGFPTEAARRTAVRLGAVAFLAKPIDPDRLLHQVEAVLGR